MCFLRRNIADILHYLLTLSSQGGSSFQNHIKLWLIFKVNDILVGVVYLDLGTICYKAGPTNKELTNTEAEPKHCLVLFQISEEEKLVLLFRKTFISDHSV